MLNKLHTFYNHSLFLAKKPNAYFYPNFHWFKDENNSQWLGIPKDAIHDQELKLLKTLLHYETFPFKTHPKSQKWYDFLFFNGEFPPVNHESLYRLIQFRLHGLEWDRNDIEEAIYGFFVRDLIILWEDNENGILIEQEPEHKINEELYLSLCQTFESDFFLKSYFYFGKAQTLAKDWPELLKKDKFFFESAIQMIPSERVYTFEKCFPNLLSNQLPKNMEEWIHSQVFQKIADEPELITTVKRFLENNSNATLTAKQLYIHRNTLQYRLEKFTNKTGISLKDYHSSITVYLACLLYYQNGKR